MNVRSVMALVLVASHLASTGAAYGQTRTDADVAAELYGDGLEKKQRGDLQGALIAFRAADAIMGVPTTALKLAEVEVALGQLVEATATLERAARYTLGPKPNRAFQAAQERARVLLNDVRARVPTLTIRIGDTSTENDGSSPTRVPSPAEPTRADDAETVAIDGVALEPTTLGQPHAVNPGQHFVTLTAGGRVLDGQTVTLAEREAVRVVLRREAPRSETAPSNAGTSRPAPVVDAVVPPPPWAFSPPALWTAGIVAATGIAVGAATGVVTYDKTTTAAESCPGRVCPTEVYPLLDEAETYGAVSTTAFVVAGVAAAWLVTGLVVNATRGRKARAPTGVGGGASPAPPGGLFSF